MPQEIHWYSNIESGAKPLPGLRLWRIVQIAIHPPDALLVLRVLLWALALPMLKRVVPVKKLAPFLWTPSRHMRQHSQEQKIATIVRWIYLFIFTNDRSCLQRSLLLYRFLSQNNSNPVLVTGIRHAEDQNWKGHAWILVDGKPFDESSESVQKYRPLLQFRQEGIMLQLDSSDSIQQEPTRYPEML